MTIEKISKVVNRKNCGILHIKLRFAASVFVLFLCKKIFNYFWFNFQGSLTKNQFIFF